MKRTVLSQEVFDLVVADSTVGLGTKFDRFLAKLVFKVDDEEFAKKMEASGE